MTPPIRFAAVQLCTTPDVEANNRAIAEAVARGAAAGAQVVCLPEAANILLRDNRRYPAVCVPERDDTTLRLCRELAARHGIWLHSGSLLVRTEEGDRIWNRSYLISPRGEVVAHYDKLHTFDVRLGGQGDFQESAVVRPGEDAPLAVALPGSGLTLGFSICYDLRFGYLFHGLAKAGATVMLVPASFSAITGPLHWETLLRARAIETGSYVVAAAQCGEHDGVPTHGQSRIIGPLGEVLAGCGEEPGIACADLDPAAVADARRRLPCLEQARELAAPRLVNPAG
ncbi:carbon-nitrogen hydrolase family protein [Frateuria defendens]|uniref:carbon-nitrogen hydrolase family protein n=1 Tax=Frateuria defendens TaxID=2219559 RepID=UPI00066FC246|nr:carbon-nitrogen hydrolase family protein [Frateuria defendens]